MESKIFLQELTKAGFLTEESARKILQESSLSRREVEDLIYERRLVKEDDVLKVKSQLLKIPVKAS